MGGGGGGATSEYMQIPYVPHGAGETPFPALNFRSGAYHFHKWPNIPLRSITILIFLLVRRLSFSKFLYIQAIHCHPRPAYCSQPECTPFGQPRQHPGVSGQLECQPDVSYKVSSGGPHFHARASLQSPAFSCSSHSGAPHFFTLLRGIPPPWSS